MFLLTQRRACFTLISKNLTADLFLADRRSHLRTVRAGFPLCNANSVLLRRTPQRGAKHYETCGLEPDCMRCPIDVAASTQVFRRSCRPQRIRPVQNSWADGYLEEQ